MSLGSGPRFEMYVFVDDLEAMLAHLTGETITVLREAEDMPSARPALVLTPS